MPVYEYGCTVCGRTIDVRHGVHGHGPATCDECGGQMRKLLSPPTIVFKGSGWAKKDRQATSAPAPARTSSNGTEASDKVKSSTAAAASTKPAQPAAATSAPTGGSADA